MIISIDGPAGSGKSTIAKELGKKLNFIHFNSGSLYRGVTAFLLENNYDVKNLTNVPDFKLKTTYKNGTQYVYVNNKDYTPVLRNNEISNNTPFVSTNQFIKDKIDVCQRNFAKKHNVVVDGRDIGSYVFPNADFKFYLDCDIKERAKRRFKELQDTGTKLTLKDVEKQIAERDHFDKNKKIATLVVPKDAIIIDSTKLTIEQVVDTMYNHIKI